MTATIVNLRQARKAKKRADADAAATANRAKHGASKAERSLTEARRAQAERHIDGHKREP